MWKNRIDKAARIAIGGHIRPDGDCVGSCMGLYQYLKENEPEKEVDVYLEEIPEAYRPWVPEGVIRHEIPEGKSYDLFICLDCGDTFRVAAKLLEKGVDAPKLIQDTYYEKSYAQNQILGRALLESIVFMDGKCIASYITKKTMQFYGVKPADLDGIVSQLRVTKGVEVAIFMYETGASVYKVSLRSKERVDVSRIAAYFGGGGHARAAGFSMTGTPQDVLTNLAGQLEEELQSAASECAV